MKKVERTFYSKYIKRIIDVVLSFIILIILLPFFIIVCILILIFNHTNPFFFQIRTGMYGRCFYIFKFTTIKNDKVTRLGKFLRKTSIDELPQFFNVLIGDMSIVGPRPWIVDYYKLLTKKQKLRLNEKPGIIGLAQVNGRNNINIIEKINFDIQYIKNISFCLDVKIVFKSFKNIFENETNTLASKRYIDDELEYLKKYNNRKNKKNILLRVEK